jgi:hypothetical protein
MTFFSVMYTVAPGVFFPECRATLVGLWRAYASATPHLDLRSSPERKGKKGGEGGGGGGVGGRGVWVWANRFPELVFSNSEFH